MFAIYLNTYRSDFAKLLSEYYLNFEEIYDIANIELNVYDFILSDTILDLPDHNIIYYKCDTEGKVINDMRELLSIVGVLDDSTPSPVYNYNTAIESAYIWKTKQNNNDTLEYIGRDPYDFAKNIFIVEEPQKNTVTPKYTVDIPVVYENPEMQIINPTKLRYLPNLFVFFNLISDTGCSTLTYLFSEYLTTNTKQRICVIDADIDSNGLTQILERKFKTNLTTTIQDIIKFNIGDLKQYSSYLTQALGNLNCVGNLASSLQDKINLLDYNFNQLLELLCQQYDIVIIDGGKYNNNSLAHVTMMNRCLNNIFVCNGTSRNDMIEFANKAKSINAKYHIVVNRLARSLTTVVLERLLGKTVTASFPDTTELELFLSTGATNNVEFLNSLQTFAERGLSYARQRL